MMFYGALAENIEVRQEADGSRTISGRFPYNVRAVVSDGGRKGHPRKEEFASKAFEFRVEDPEAEIHLLQGHDYGKPLASKLSETLKLEDTEEALSFEANIPPAVVETQHGKDTLALIASGLSVGLSPGFRLPPERAVEDAEKITREPDNPDKGENGAIIRTVKAALLYELSIVTKPAFEEAEVQARNWQGHAPETPKTRPPAWRWR